MEEPTETAIKEDQSVNILHFIIKFPKIKSAANKITIFPMSHNDTILRGEELLRWRITPQHHGLRYASWR